MIEAAHESLPILEPQGTDHEMIEALKRETFDYFIQGTNPENGLIQDSTQPGSPASIAVMGLGLSCYVVAAENGWISRSETQDRVLKVLRFFHSSPQGPEADATGYKGFYYHFLKMDTGCRTWNCELSTIDTAILMAGVLTVAEYFDKEDKAEIEIRSLAKDLYCRVDWQWAMNGENSISHGWKPESGFLSSRWDRGYSEAHILYILALGSPTFPIEKESYLKWISTFEFKKIYGKEYIYAGPLFIHQMSQIWLDFRNLRDPLNDKLGFDYFQNSRRATQAQRLYAIENPQGYSHYGENCWGITASAGPGPAELIVDGKKRIFYDYIARGAPLDIDDGTISPWAVVTALPFAPEITLSAIRHAIERLQLKNFKRAAGFDASFNPTFPDRHANKHGWVAEWRLGLNQGPIVLMIENYQTELVWQLYKKCSYVVSGLKKAGFHGGWL